MTERSLAAQSSMPWLDRLLFAIFDKFARASLTSGALTLELPDGRTCAYGDATDVAPAVPSAPAWMALPPRRCTMRVLNTDVFYKVITRHDSGLGEAFMAGDFEVDDLGAFMAVITANARNIESTRGMLGFMNYFGDKLLYLAHLGRGNTIEGSKKNISEHYDAGNDMYKLFLDESLTYSAGIHTDGGSLHDAQLAKLDALIDAAKVTEQSHVLEVGCGWGSAAIRAVERTNCRWTGITVSQEQLVEAQARVKARGLADRINLVFCDYRDVPARFGCFFFDAVVSCEMIEAVGHEHLPTYFEVIGSCLKPGGLFAMQVIAMPDARYEEYCNASDFIREHIFPGGHLPSMGAMTACASAAGLSAVGLRDIGPDYAITLREWRARWKAKWEEIRALGYSEVFMRKWAFYFAYCEAAFDCSYIQDYQIVWQRGSHPLPSTGRLSRAPSGSPTHFGAAVDSESAPSSPRSLLHAPRGLSLMNEPVTAVLWAVYCVLAGVVVARRPLMVTALATFALGWGMLKAMTKLSTVMVPRFMALPAGEQAEWIVDSTHAAWALLLALPAGSMLLSLSSWETALRLQDTSLSASLLVCAATGCWACHLAGLVRFKLTQRRPASFMHSVLLLAVFGASAFKQEHTGLLAMLLPCQLCSVTAMVRKLFILRKTPVPRLVTAANFLTQALLRYVLQAVVLALVLAFPNIWSSPLHYLLASNGMLYVNWLNVRKLLGRHGRLGFLAGSAPSAAVIDTAAFTAQSKASRLGL